MRMTSLLLTLALASMSSAAHAQQPADQAYKVVNSAKVGGEGGFDYVTADSVGRRLYIPRGNRVTVFDLDTLKPQGEIANTNGVHGAAIDPVSGHGFSSSKPVVMWDAKTLATIKTIDVEGNPDGILFEPATSHIFVLSHRAPNVTVINAADGAIVGTIDLGGAPEQGASDGKGHVYIDVEDKDNVAVVDANTLKVTGHYDLHGKGSGPAGLGLDAQNHVLFSFCRNPAVCVVLSADDGKILTTLPIGRGTDGGGFNPNTMEAFSSQGDGTLTIIKEKSPTDFAVEQTVETKPGAKTCTLDTKTNQILLITAERAAATSQPATTPPPATTQAASGGQGQRNGGRRGGGSRMVPGSFQILVVGK
jgi:DNA-binding beta-propeller fold protein YncE